MKNVEKRLLITFIVTLTAGAILHFLFRLWPSLLTEFLAPVNESLWEHIKLLYWPYLAAGAYLTRRGIWHKSRWLGALLVICLLLEGIAWLIHYPMNVNLPALDISLYILLMGLGFFLPAILPLTGKDETLMTALTVILGGLILCWTIYPPDAALFRDLSAIHTSALLPY